MRVLTDRKTVKLNMHSVCHDHGSGHSFLKSLSHPISSCCQIVMLTNHPKSSEHPNVHEVQHGLLRLKEEKNNMFEVRSMGTMGGFQLLAETLPAVAREMYQVPVVKELYEKRKEFDLIVVSHRYNEVSVLQ